MLTETWLKSIHEIHPILGGLSDFYDVVRCDRPRKQGGGVATFLKKDIPYAVILRESVPDSYEILSCDVFPNGPCPFRLTVVYRTPSCPAKSSLNLIKVLSDISACDQSSIIVGDFNFSDITWDTPPSCSTPVSQSFLNMCSVCNYVQVVHQPTRGENTLDLVLSNNPLLVSRATVRPPIGSSDHSSVKGQGDNTSPN